MEAEAEDYAEYHIYPLLGSSESDIVWLQTRRVVLLEFLSKTYIKDYIWHREPFTLEVTLPKDDKDRPHLKGKTKYGENIEDEWFIVFLLFELSKQFTDVAISVRDNDGEFLMIEAALAIPRWLKPENSENRIWIKEGHLHIIPLPRTPAQLSLLPAQLTISNALTVLSSDKVTTQAEQKVQEVIAARIGCYPEKSSEFHVAKCFVPIDIARILEYAPQLVAPAINAFYHRDIEGMFFCSKMEKFPPKDERRGSKAMALTTVRFTRCLYAQLACQRFFPPKVFELPPETDSRYKSMELGMKLACGFEILYQMGKKTARYLNQSNIDSLDVETYPFSSDREWKTFDETLQKIGYFGEEIRGSKEYRRKELFAKQNYLESLKKAEESKDQHTSVLGINEALLIDTILEKAKGEEPGDTADDSLHLRCARALRPDDNEDWMKISPNELDGMLAQRQMEFDEYDKKQETKKRPKREGEKGKEKDAFNKHETALKEFEGVVGNMKNFVDTVSAFDGAEFPRGSKGQASAQMDFDPDLFIRIMKNSLAADNDDDARDDDDAMSEEEHFYSLSEDEDEFLGDDDDEERKEEEKAMHDLMEQMDRELYATKVGQDFEKQPADLAEGDTQPIGVSAGDSFRPVDVDLNLMKNILESLDAQQGLPGPLSNILHEMKRGNK